MTAELQTVISLCSIRRNIADIFHCQLLFSTKIATMPHHGFYDDRRVAAIKQTRRHISIVLYTTLLMLVFVLYKLFSL